MKNKKESVRVQRRTALIGSLGSSTLKKDIRTNAGNKYKDEEEWPKVQEKMLGSSFLI